jgi:uncharacterized protein (TIGR00297 family)
LISRFGASRKHQFSEIFAKGSRRDFSQVMANGGFVAGLAILLGITGEDIWLAGLSAALATVNADTWSTEIGILAKRWPVLITTGKRVEPGTSGGVTAEGTIAALGGATLIGLAAAGGQGDPRLAIAASLGGVIGAMIDSLLGASVQAMYFCDACQKQTERHPEHVCGTSTVYRRGWRWFGNDLVNFLSSAFGALAAIGIWLL